MVEILRAQTTRAQDDGVFVQRQRAWHPGRRRGIPRSAAPLGMTVGAGIASGPPKKADPTKQDVGCNHGAWENRVGEEEENEAMTKAQLATQKRQPAIR
jgi:hypothetical protein